MTTSTKKFFTERLESWDKYLKRRGDIAAGRVWTPEEARAEFDFDIDLKLNLEPDWGVKVVPWEGAESGYGYTLISPEGWQIRPDDTYISPEGESFTSAEIEEQRTQWEAPQYAPEAPKAEEIFDLMQRLYPEERYGEMEQEAALDILWKEIEEQPDVFFQGIAGKGRNEDTEALLKAIGLTEGQTSQVFLPSFEELATQFYVTKEGTIAPGGAMTQRAIEYVGGKSLTSQDIRDWLSTDEGALEFISKIQHIAWMEDAQNLLRSLGLEEEYIEQLVHPSPITIGEQVKAFFSTDIMKQSLTEALPLLVKPRTTDAAIDYFSQNIEGLRRELITAGRNEATENLVRQLYPDITEQGLKDYFSLDALAKESWIVTAREKLGIAGTFVAGWGDLIANTGGVLQWLGAKGIGAKLIKTGREAGMLAAPVPFEPDAFTWKQMLNPQFYATYGVRMLPTLITLAIPALGAYALAGRVAVGVAGRLGVGAFGTKIITAIGAGVGGAVLSRPVESAMEAGAAYDEARNSGLSHEEAERVADEVFKGNLALVGMDFLQLTAAFMPTPFGKAGAGLITKGLVKTATIGGKMFFLGLTEGGEEIYQEMIRLKAMGDERGFSEMIEDPEMKLVFSLGAIAGIGMGAGAEILMRIQNRVISQFTPEQTAQFNTEKSGFINEGLAEGIATQKALDVVVEANPELESVVEDATNIVDKEITFDQIKPKDEADRIAIEHLREQTVGTRVKEFLAGERGAIGKPADITGLPEELKGLVRNAANLSKEQFITQYRAGLAEQNLTRRETAQKIDAYMKRTLKITPEQFYDTYVKPLALPAPEVGVAEGVISRGWNEAELRIEAKKKNYRIARIPYKPEKTPYTYRIEGVKGTATEGTKVYARSLMEAQNYIETGSLIAKPEVTPPAVEEAKPVEATVREQLDDIEQIVSFWKNEIKTLEETKASLSKFVRENLPMAVRGRFITAVARVKTNAQLETQMAKVQEIAELNAQKTLKAEIRKEIKRTQAKVKEHILKGKFTPEVQRRLDTLNHNLELDRDTARDKMADNIAKFESGELAYEEMLEANEALNYAGIEGMSSEELANTLEYIKAIRDYGRSIRQGRQEANTERITAIRTDISYSLTGGKGLKTGIGAVPRGELAAKTGWWDTFTNWQYGIDNLADKISKLDPRTQVPTFEKYSSVINKFVSQVHRATNRQVIGTKEAFAKVKDVVADVFKVKGTHDINQILNSLDEEVNLGTFELTGEYKVNHPTATTITIKMTRDEMLSKYMQMQDPTLNNTFTTGMGWSQQVRDTIESNLTEQEKKLADAIFGFYEGYYQSVNEIYQELYNVDMPHNPKYSPIRRDFESNIAENLLTFQDASQYASVLNGSLKARVKNIRPLRFNGATKILSNHIEQMEHFKAWATTMRDMRRVFGSQQIRQAIEQYHGRGVVRLIDTFMNQMARGGVEMAATNRTADYLRRNFTKSILAIKPVIALKQIPSFFAYISEMNVSDFFTGVADYWKSPVANFKFLYKNSEMFRARMSVGFERDIRAAMEKHGKRAISGQGGFTNWFLLQIRAGDTFAVTQGMWAKYKAGLKQGLSQADAIAAAEDTTGRTQPSFGIDTLSAIQNGGSFLKLMTMFQNQPNKYFRIVGDNTRNFKYGRGSRAKAASTILLAWVILPMIFQFIADAFQWKPEREARAGILGPLNFILIGGQLIQSAWGWLTDQPFDYQISPVAQTGRDLQMIFLKARKLVAQGQDPYKDIDVSDVAALVEYLAKAGGQVTGLPTPYLVQVEKLIRHKFEKGEEIEIKDFLFSEWALEPPKRSAEQQVDDATLKLGEVDEGQEDRPLTEKELKLYDTVKWFREMGGIYSKVLPQDVLDNMKASKESKTWAEMEIARSEADTLPDVPLYRINTNDNDDTIINYYQQWQARLRIDSLDKLNDFDKLYPKAYLGNVTRQQYDLLKGYLGAEDKDAFLEAHKDELGINPRNEWLKNPVNARGAALLALAGDAKILTMGVYNEFKKLIKELDIPDSAIPEQTLPPDDLVEPYLEITKLWDEGKTVSSWEGKLILVKNPGLCEWNKEWDLPDTPIESLELKTEKIYRDTYNKLNDQDYLDTLDDKIKDANGLTERDRYVAELKMTKIGDETYIDVDRRIEAIENEGLDYQDQWVERGHTIDEFGAGSSEAMVWLLDNSDAFKWALDNELLTDDGSDWNEPVLRINVKYREQDEWYDEGIPDKYKDIENPAKRDAKIAEERKGYLLDNFEYYQDRYRRDAYGTNSGAPDYRPFPEEYIETYVEWYTSPGLKKPDDYPENAAFWEDDWYMLENKKFHDEVWVKLLGNDPYPVKRRLTKEGIEYLENKDGNPSKTPPTRELGAKYLKYKSLKTGKERDQYRIVNSDMDKWAVAVGIWTMTMTEKRKRMRMTISERKILELQEQYEDWEKKMEELEREWRRVNI